MCSRFYMTDFVRSGIKQKRAVYYKPHVYLLVESGGVDGFRLTLGVRLSSVFMPKNKRTARSEPHVHLLVESGGVEPPSENRFTRLSTRLVNHLNLPIGTPVDRITSGQPFGYGKSYKAITQDVGCCVTPKPKPQHSSAGRKLHLGSY